MTYIRLPLLVNPGEDSVELVNLLHGGSRTGVLPNQHKILYHCKKRHAVSSLQVHLDIKLYTWISVRLSSFVIVFSDFRLLELCLLICLVKFVHLIIISSNNSTYGLRNHLLQ